MGKSMVSEKKKGGGGLQESPECPCPGSQRRENPKKGKEKIEFYTLGSTAIRTTLYRNGDPTFS